MINEVEAEPLSDYVIDFLTAQRKESPYLDFKLIINLRKDSNFSEIAKDFFALSNYGGGWILVGWEEYKPSQYVPVGLPEDYEADQATLQEKFNSFCDDPLVIGYLEFEKDFGDLFAKSNDTIKKKVNSVSKRFAAIFVPPSNKILKHKKEGKYNKGSKEKIVFRKDDVFYRRGTQSISSPSKQEFSIIKKRLEKENYRLSVLSGEPDEVEETIYGNLFEVTQLPKFIYSGDQKFDGVSIKVFLKQENIFPEWYHKFKIWNGKILTFENLYDVGNVYGKLVQTSSIKKEPIDKWLEDPDKNRIIVELLNRELKHYAMGKGFFYFDDKNKLYYSALATQRKETWKGKYGISTRTVAAKMYAEQLKRFIYWHAAFFPNFLQINKKFYFRILPTFIITEDGKKPIFGPRVGTIITRLSYNKYNNSYLNTIRFWIHQLENEENIQIKDYLTISTKPVELKTSVGILYDIPSSEFRLEIDGDEEDLPIEEMPREEGGDEF